MPLGSEKEVKTDTWIIAATNRNLQEDVNEKRFRQDLYYRLNIIKINIPPLRERTEDIPLLIDHYFQRYYHELNGNGVRKPGHRIVEKLMDYTWPGNVRQLQNLIKKALVFAAYLTAWAFHG